MESNILYTRNECDLNCYCGIGDKREEAKVGRDTNGVHFTRPGAPLMKRVKERERVIRDSQNSGISTSLRRRILKDKLTCCGDQNVVFKEANFDLMIFDLHKISSCDIRKTCYIGD